eukprot:CAMPEP_0113644590 /NCGR_PEP_ID=MMETSP0017_2-20120614/23470_1 /TAXON_ID=2856 /ORGANISM="Cylindrotheca closterium" /LENGTH=31 /DNA_ID=CAMNT_0000556213 /DNA_START=399 /DNA_END=490 /DNA_ORIENTATION=+ /assembly_acc=CAM_ASM_000147
MTKREKKTHSIEIVTLGLSNNGRDLFSFPLP